MQLYHSSEPMRFHDGGFVIHGITSPAFKGRVSAWFNAQGIVLDAEQRANLASNATRLVVRSGPIWQALATLGHCNATRAKE